MATKKSKAVKPREEKHSDHSDKNLVDVTVITPSGEFADSFRNDTVLRTVLEAAGKEIAEVIHGDAEKQAKRKKEDDDGSVQVFSIGDTETWEARQGTRQLVLARPLAENDVHGNAAITWGPAGWAEELEKANAEAED